jgi:uncharacterized alpha-E superfamily protein
MIARVAEHCFWLHRYMERAENTARLLQVNLSFLLDVSLPPDQLWRPVLLAAGEEQQFRVRFGRNGEADGDTVQQFMVWDRDNPVSLVNSVQWARENARTIRETVSLEMWRSLNEFFLWMSGGSGERMFQRERHAFYDQVKESCQLFHGQYHTTMLYDRPFDFMRLGSLLERSDQTVRLLGAMAPRMPLSGDGGPSASSVWLALLRSCSAVESFAKRSAVPTGAAVVDFLLREPDFPRAVMHGLLQARHFLGGRAELSHARLSRPMALLDEAIGALQHRPLNAALSPHFPDELESLQGTIANITDAIRRSCFEIPAALEQVS